MITSEQKLETLENGFRNLQEAHHIMCNIVFQDRHTEKNWLNCTEETCKLGKKILQQLGLEE